MDQIRPMVAKIVLLVCFFNLRATRRIGHMYHSLFIILHIPTNTYYSQTLFLSEWKHRLSAKYIIIAIHVFCVIQGMDILQVLTVEPLPPFH